VGTAVSDHAKDGQSLFEATSLSAIGWTTWEIEPRFSSSPLLED